MKLPPNIAGMELLTPEELAAVQALPDLALRDIGELVSLLEQLPQAHVRSWLAIVLHQLLGQLHAHETICAALNLYERRS